MEIKVKGIVKEDQKNKDSRLVVYFQFIEDGKIIATTNTYYDEKEIEEFLKKEIQKIKNEQFTAEKEKIQKIINKILQEV